MFGRVESSWQRTGWQKVVAVLASLVVLVSGCGASAAAPTSTATATRPAVSPVVKAATPAPPPPTPTRAATATTVAPAPTASAPAAASSPTPVASPTPTAKPSATATTAPTTVPTQSVQTSVGLKREFPADMAEGQVTSVTASPTDGVTLLKGSDGRYAPEGQIVSKERTSPLRFDDLVLSWNADAPSGTGLTFAVRVRSGSEWSGWYTMGTWRKGIGASVPGQQDAWGTVEVDTLVLKRQADGWQYRVTLATADPMLTPRVRNVTMAVADRSRAPAGPAVTLPAGWVRDLAVPTESQVLQDPAVAWDICSPTSLTMILRYWGVQTSPPQVYKGVRDGSAGIYGNWPLNTAYAGTLNFDAYVARLYSLDQLRAEIAAGRPAAVSIKYGAGELPGAPLNSTSGHIIVVRGFTDKGEVIVNDPAAPDLASVRRVLRAADLEKVWLRSGGIAYLVAPRP